MADYTTPALNMSYQMGFDNGLQEGAKRERERILKILKRHRDINTPGSPTWIVQDMGIRTIEGLG